MDKLTKSSRMPAAAIGAIYDHAWLDFSEPVTDGLWHDRHMPGFNRHEQSSHCNGALFPYLR